MGNLTCFAYHSNQCLSISGTFLLEVAGCLFHQSFQHLSPDNLFSENLPLITSLQTNVQKHVTIFYLMEVVNVHFFLPVNRHSNFRFDFGSVLKNIHEFSPIHIN